MVYMKTIVKTPNTFKLTGITGINMRKFDINFVEK